MSRVNLKRFGLLIVIFALVLRIGILSQRFDSLSDDRDAYLGIAKGIVEGNGFSVPGTDLPTAFRPPLYPFLVAATLSLGGLKTLAAVQVILSTGIVFLTIQLGRKLWNEKAGLLAGIFVALDPLLNWYVAFPMTETTFTFLVMLLMSAVYRNVNENQFRFGSLQQVVVGVVFGLAVLCRPSILAFPIILLAWLLLLRIWKSTSESNEYDESSFLKYKVPMVLAAVLVLLPWGIRNYSQIGKFTFTTTHGGYTILLGNNPVFYKQVVQAPWGTTWGDLPADDPNSQTSWVTALHEKAKVENIQGEVAIDRWMYDRAIENIKSEPLLFLKSCLLRVARFWNFAPQGPQRAQIPSIALWGITLFYAFQFVLFLGFLISLRNRWRFRRIVAPLLILVLTFTLVHSVYWSNMRMRAPLIPIIALFSAGAMINDAQNEPISK